MDTRAREIEAKFPDMVYMLRYYHMNWIDDPRYKKNGALHPDHVLLHFIEAERSTTATAAQNDLRMFLEVPYTEDELDRILYTIDVNIRPSFRGLTTRQWLEHLIKLLDKLS